MTFHYRADDIADGDIEGYLLSLPVPDRGIILATHLRSMTECDEDETMGWLGLALANGDDVQKALIRDLTATLTSDWYALGMNRFGGVTECGGLTYEDRDTWERMDRAIDEGMGRFMVYVDEVLHEFMVGGQ